MHDQRRAWNDIERSFTERPDHHRYITGRDKPPFPGG
jgi:hypothetical protein